MKEGEKGMPGRIYRLLLPGERRTAVFAIAAMFINVLLDLMSLAALFPVLYFLLEKEENRRATLLFCLLAMVVIGVKCVAATVLVRYQNRFLLSLYRRLSMSLYSSFYRRGLLFIRCRGINRIGHEVNGICYTFSQGLLAPFMRMTGDGLFLLLAGIALLWYAPLIAAILLVSFLPFMWAYVVAIRRKVKYCGDREQLAKREQWRTTADTFGGYAELEVNNAFPRFRDLFMQGLQEISNNRLKMDLLMRMPVFFSELSAITGLALLAVFAGGDVKIVVGVFAVAAFRLLPAMRSVMAGWTQVQNAACCLDILEKGLDDLPVPTGSEECKPAFEKEIVLSGLSYSYPDGEHVLSDFSCVIRKGEYIGFSGYSGVGKSTLFNLLSGFLTPDKGKILVDGMPLSVCSRSAWLEQLGYVPQEVYIFQGTLAENVALGEVTPDRERIIRLLGQVRLDSWLETLPEGIDTRLSERGEKLSGGQRQRIGIARALYRQTKILLLDEATSALDDKTEKEVNSILCELREQHNRLTILSIAHRESSLAFCDRVVEVQ